MTQILYRSLFLACGLMLFDKKGRARTTEENHKLETNFKINPHLLSIDSLDIIGKITDSTGTAIEGVVVTEQGTTNSVLSNENGEYKIAANPNGMLVFLKSGFATQEIHVNNQIGRASCRK